VNNPPGDWFRNVTERHPAAAQPGAFLENSISINVGKIENIVYLSPEKRRQN
jgi:hypothetical protein